MIDLKIFAMSKTGKALISRMSRGLSKLTGKKVENTIGKMHKVIHKIDNSQKGKLEWLIGI